MKYILCLILFALSLSPVRSQNTDSVVIRKLFDEALRHGESYKNLDYLSNRIGGRLSGSPQAAKAVAFGLNTMKELHADTAYLQECMVPHWVRGVKEKAFIQSKKGGNRSVQICALGGSVPTPAKGIQGAIIEVQDLAELKKIGRKGIAGKIVFFNRPFDQTFISTFDGYDGAIDQRWAGPSAAAEFGAIATVCRSLTPDINDFPHTGSMRYDTNFVKIPCCAISTLGAELLSQLHKEDPDLKFWFLQSCKKLPDVQSFNVIAEIKGSLHPEEIIVVGGHLDSWDIGDGASDDGTGVVQSMEVLRLFKASGIRPKRTIRAVLFMNEENGVRGGKKYAEIVKQTKEKNILAMESDRGGFSPKGFSTDMNAQQLDKVLSWKKLFIPYGIYDFSETGGGSDIEPLKPLGVPLMELIPDSQRYFDIHHTSNDTFSRVSRRELELGGASMAAMIYLFSEYGFPSSPTAQ
jgi:carboxypeptidase Q